MSNDKVTPMFPGLEHFRRTAEAYEGPTQAIKVVLDEGDFNKAVTGRGWVELRIVARFEEAGCMFHTVQCSNVIMPNAVSKVLREQANNGVNVPAPNLALDEPAFRVLRKMAEVHHRALGFYVNLATIGQIEILNEELIDATDEDIGALIDGHTSTIESKNWQRSHLALDALFTLGKARSPDL